MDKHSGCVPLGWSGSGSIQDRRGLWFIKRTDESNLGKNSLVLLMYHDLSDLGSLIRIRITTKKCVLRKPHQGRTSLIWIWRSGKPIIIWMQLCKFPVVPGGKQWEYFTFLFHSHQVVGFTSSGSYSYQLKKSICFAYLPPPLTEPGSRVEVEMLGNKFPAVVVQQPLFDPQLIRAKRW